MQQLNKAMDPRMLQQMGGAQNMMVPHSRSQHHLSLGCLQNMMKQMSKMDQDGPGGLGGLGGLF